MNGHLDDAVLFAAGDLLDAATRSHLATCEACRQRQARLIAGRALIDEVRRDSSVDVNWRAIDQRVMAAAEQSAQDIRAGRLRPSRRPMVMAYAGVALAAAAALVFAVRMRAPTSTATEPSSQHAAPLANANGSSGGSAEPPVARGGGTIAPSQVIEPHVIMLSTPVTYADAGETPGPMTSRTHARAGGRLATGDRSGRAVLALHAGYRVDARPGTDIALDTLTAGDMTMALTKGEARIDGPARDDGRVALRVGAWTVLAKGGGFVTRITGDSARVRVISGKVHVAREGGAEREVLAGDEIELSSASAEPRLVSHDVADPFAIDERLLAEQGEVVEIPVLADATSLAIDGLALPLGLSALRVFGLRTLDARVGADQWTLALDPSAANNALAWHRVRAATVAVRAARVETPPVVPVAVATAQMVPTVEPMVVPPETGVAATRDQFDGNFSARASRCFAACIASHTCGPQAEAHVHIDTERDGRVNSVRVADVTSTEVSTCIERVARATRIPSFMTSQTVHLTVRAAAQ